MIATFCRRLVAAGVALLLATGAMVAARRPAALPAGPAIVVIAPAVPSPDDLASETYGDFAEYLNVFAGQRPAGLRLVRVTPARWRRLVRAPMTADSYAVLFLRPGGPALLYDGMPVEPAVYAAGARWALGGATPDEAVGFRAVTIVRRR